MVKTWKDALEPEEVKTLQKLENDITVLKHKRYKIQNAASKRVSDALKAKLRKARKPKKPKPRKPRSIAVEIPVDSPQS